MNDEFRDLYQQVILDHSRRPRHYGKLPPPCVHVHGDNPSCGDEVDVYVRFDEAGGVEEVMFDGQGCAISQAAASMMTQKVRGLRVAEVRRRVADFRALVTGDGEVVDGDALGELQLLEGVRSFPQRVKCAMLAWRALEQALDSESSIGG